MRAGPGILGRMRPHLPQLSATYTQNNVSKPLHDDAGNDVKNRPMSSSDSTNLATLQKWLHHLLMLSRLLDVLQTLSTCNAEKVEKGLSRTTQEGAVRCMAWQGLFCQLVHESSDL